MKFYNFINESYSNWVFPDNKTMEEDFIEYKKKEKSKWENRAQIYGFRFPIFNDLEHFKESLKTGKIISLNDSFADKVNNLTSLKTIESLKSMVSGYYKPRDVDRIISGIKNNDKIPMGIILKGKNGYFIMAGNTRQNTARILGIIPKMILINVSKN
jgi:hypothetical protein